MLAMDPALRKSIEIAGSLRALGRIASVSHQAIMKWTRVPAERVRAIEAATGIHRSVLRPDIYPPNEYHPPLKRAKK
jgi:DNA-binding transcriptional regulator YdaS (Cro superfamily)